jgi:hypothetical protein
MYCISKEHDNNDFFFIKIGLNTINHSHKHENARKYKIHKHVPKWSLIHKNIHELSHEILCFLQLIRK